MAKTNDALAAFAAGKGALDAAVKASRYLSRGRYDRALASLAALLALTPDIVVPPAPEPGPPAPHEPPPHEPPPPSPPEPPPPAPDPGPTPAPPPEPTPGAAIDVTRMAVKIDGQLVRAADGADLGNWKPPGFTIEQRNVLTKASPWSVFFRPHVDGSNRNEVVIERGTVFGPSPVLTPATSVAVEILYDGKAIDAFMVPLFEAWTRVPWESAELPIARTPVELAQMKLAYSYSKQGLAKINMAGDVTYLYGGLAGIEPNMKTTGGRGDIGPQTAWVAAFLLGGSAASMRAQAKAAGSLPVLLRDDKTNAPLSLLDYPQASTFRDGTLIAGAPHFDRPQSRVTLDGAHFPHLSYIPAVATGSLYDLENLQFQITAILFGLDPTYRLDGQGIIGTYQTRWWAWVLLLLVRACKATPSGALTKSLLPKAELERLLDENRRWFQNNYVENPNPQQAVWHDISELGNSRDEGAGAPGGRWIAPWMNDFAADGPEECVYLGYPEWTPVADWTAELPIILTSLDKDWDRGYPNQYRIIIARTRGQAVATIKEGWELTKAGQGLKDTDGSKIVTTPEPDWNYMANRRYSLTAIVLRRPQYKPLLDWIAPQLGGADTWGVDAQLCIASPT